MDRKQFLKTCGLGCLGSIAAVSLLNSCSSARSMNSSIDGDNLVVPTSDFGNETHGFRKFIVVNNDLLKFPICVFRHTADSYSALWMECTHMGAELQVFGDTLQCPAHGSEFSDRGVVRNGPADRALRSFPISIEMNLIKISLKKQ
ncbi:QcrA and Rieske domain-containing protein [Flavobacterium sp.]|uniref:QcrA and Rieske domain-containing protein n=1 Tax=Flavobacterium sp. TaxID=239 RepID=UPI0040343C6D